MRMRSRSAPPPAEMPTIAPVESDLDDDEFAMEDVFDEVGFAPAEVVAEAVLEGSVANEDAEADVDKPVTDAPELVEEVEAEVLAADGEDEVALPEDVELDLPVLLDVLDDLSEEVELDLDSFVEDSVTVTLLEMTVSVTNIESRWLVVNDEVVTNVETRASSSSSALRWPAFTGIKPSSTSAMAGLKSRRKKPRSAGEHEDERKRSEAKGRMEYQ